MRLLIPLALATVALAGIPALAPAVVTSRDYNGSIEAAPPAFIAFNVEATDGGRKVKKMLFGQLPYTCQGDPPGLADGMKVKGSFKVRAGEFGGKREAIPTEVVDPQAKLTGKLKQGGKAKGTIRVRGELGGPGTDCHTATLDWKAEKGAF